MPKPNSQETKGLLKMYRWGLNNFHKLEEGNQVKMWLKICDKFQADKEGEGAGKLLQLLLSAGRRSEDNQEGA